jgi:hypothetical protein
MKHSSRWRYPVSGNDREYSVAMLRIRQRYRIRFYMRSVYEMYRPAHIYETYTSLPRIGFGRLCEMYTVRCVHRCRYIFGDVRIGLPHRTVKYVHVDTELWITSQGSPDVAGKLLCPHRTVNCVVNYEYRIVSSQGLPGDAIVNCDETLRRNCELHRNYSRGTPE